MQWGTTSQFTEHNDVNKIRNIPFPIPFKNRCLNIVIAVDSSEEPMNRKKMLDYDAQIDTYNKSSFNLFMQEYNGWASEKNPKMKFRWFAIGY